MIRTDDTHDPPDSRWVESLHAAIAAETPGVGEQSSAASATDFEEVRDCLHLLNRLRQERHKTGERPRKIGRFTVVREVGRGGFGVVLAALDPRVGRQVAIKIPRPEVLASHTTRSRFLREAQAAGALSHPNLIAVHEVGEEGPVCYIVSELCHGTNLSQWLAARDSQPAEREAVEIVIPLARAVAHAHRRGVLHRDIKPSNVLLEPSEPGLTGAATVDGLCFRPLLTDFGLARISEFIEEHTCTGTLLGTPAYMAPEQAEGRINSLTLATDIYALGVLLYELLAGQPPLRGETDLQTLQLVARGEMPALKSRRPGVSRDLAAIVHKCLETTPARRYASADDLADDLERFLTSQPTKARPTGILVRAVKWSRRRPMSAALAVVVLSSAAVLVNLGWGYLEQRQLAARSEQARQREVAQRLYVASMNSAADALSINYRQQVRDQLEAWIPRNGEPDRRSFAWHYLNRQLDDATTAALAGHSGGVYHVKYSADGKLLATASADRTARIWNVDTGECQQILRGHTNEVNCVAIHPNGQTAATAGDDGRVIVWDLADGGKQLYVKESKARRFGVAFHPEGAMLAVCSEFGVALYDATSGKSLRQLIGHFGSVGAVAFSGSGQWLASASEDGTVIVWDVATGTERGRLALNTPANAIAFSPDDRWLVGSGRTGRRVHLFELSTMTDRGKVYQSFDWIHAVAFHPSGEYFAVATKDGTIDFVELASRSVVRRIRGHDSRVWSLAFANDGRRLVSAGAQGAIRIWDLESGNCNQFQGPSGDWSRLLLTPNGRTAVGLNDRGAISAFDINRREQLWQSFGDMEVIGDFDGNAHPDAAIFQQGTWKFSYDAQSIHFQDPPRTVQFGEAGDLPVVGDWNGDGRDDLGCYRPGERNFYLDLDGCGGCPEMIVRGPSDIGTLATPVAARWPEDSREVPGVLTISALDRATWQIHLLHRGEWRGLGLVRGGDQETWLPLFGKWQTGSIDHQVGVLRGDQAWSSPLPSDNWNSGRTQWIQPVFQPLNEHPLSPRALLAAHEALRSEPRSLSISPTATRVATIHSHDPRVRINDALSGHRLATLEDDHLVPSVAEYDPSGATLAVGTTHGVVVQYDAKSLHRLRIFQPHKNSINQIFHSPDGSMLGTVDSNGAIVVSRKTGEEIGRLKRDRMDLVTTLAFSRDGTLCAICSPLRPISIHNTHTGERLRSLIGEAIDSRTAAFSDDGRTLATSGESGQVILWDTATWDRLLSVPTGDVALAQLLFSENDSELVGLGSTSQGSLRVLRWRAPVAP